MGKTATLAESYDHQQKARDYAWCIQWFRTFEQLAGDTISAQRMIILLTIAEHDPRGIDQGKLGDVTGIEKSALSRSLLALAKYVPPSASAAATPLVAVTLDPDDRRKRVVRLTGRGRQLIHKLYGNCTKTIG